MIQISFTVIQISRFSVKHLMGRSRIASMPVGPKELLEQLKATIDGVGLLVNADNVAAVAKLMLDREAEVFAGDDGLRVRLAGHGED